MVLTAATTAPRNWEAQAEFQDYMSAVNPVMPGIGVDVFPQSLYEAGESRVIPLDLAAALQTPYPCTTPNLLASFVRINASKQVDLATPATSHMFYVIRGRGETHSHEFGTIPWQAGDLLTYPGVEQLRHLASEDAALYWVCDAPLLQYLGVMPQKHRFSPVLYSREKLDAALQKAREEHGQANRSGILLSNPNFPQTRTLTHTLWSLYNSLPAGVTQKPHRHNSVALDYCVAAGADTYTLIGRELDDQGQIVDPVKALWVPGAMFVTPPGYWHSHHNNSDVDAVVLPIQDAGLLTNMQLLDFQYVE
ncbi:MAG: hypothetical protein HC824_11265 [Synechococcales cyanobacterium RM1_1_8]|nr:hypothetical protein [Synechococcales cyanobacterium RM1_1_8]